MKQILVISDSHLDQETLEEVNHKFKDFTYKIHCGDAAVVYDDPSVKDYLRVRGNHDYDDRYPMLLVLDIDNIRILVIHGHQPVVWYGYDEIIEIAKAYNCKIVLHGHTHIPTVEWHDDILCLNPGSLMFNRGSYGYGTYVILTINDDKSIKYHYYHHKTHEEVTKTVLEDGIIFMNDLKQYLIR